MTTVRAIYFSPTGTTKKIVSAVAKGISDAPAQHYDLTFAIEGMREHLADGIAVIGIPVYAGRVPEDCLDRLAGFSADNIPAVLIALYGNREFEDALVELRDVVTAKGFQVVAAGAFIGEHSYSTPDRPIAAGRPDENDLRLASEFGQKVRAKVAGGDLSSPEIEGNTPYRERVQFGGIAPETDKGNCTLCNRCVNACPVAVIKIENGTVETFAENCIMCVACVRSCQDDARFFTHPFIEERRSMLIKNCSTPKQPKTFV